MNWGSMEKKFISDMQKLLWITQSLLGKKNALFQTQQLLVSGGMPRPSFHTGHEKGTKGTAALVHCSHRPREATTCTSTWRIRNIYGSNWQNETRAPKDWWQASSSFYKQLFQHVNGLNKTKHPSRRLISKSNTESRCDMKKQHSPGLLRILTSQRKCKPEQKNSLRL